jgi:hypothetical protein
MIKRRRDIDDLVMDEKVAERNEINNKAEAASLVGVDKFLRKDRTIAFQEYTERLEREYTRDHPDSEQALTLKASESEVPPKDTSSRTQYRRDGRRRSPPGIARHPTRGDRGGGESQGDVESSEEEGGTSTRGKSKAARVQVN